MGYPYASTHICGHPRVGSRPNCVICHREISKRYRERKKFEAVSPPPVFVSLARRAWR